MQQLKLLLHTKIEYLLHPIDEERQMIVCQIAFVS